MTKELLDKIEDSRYRLYDIGPLKKEKLLRESRKLDLLILEYYKYINGDVNNKRPGSS